MMAPDFWSLNFGHFLTILVLGAGGIGFAYTVRGRVDALSDRMLSVENNIKQLVEVLVQQGRMQERLKTIDERQLAEGRRVDDLTKRVNDWIDRRS